MKQQPNVHHENSGTVGTFERALTPDYFVLVFKDQCDIISNKIVGRPRASYKSFNDAVLRHE